HLPLLSRSDGPVAPRELRDALRDPPSVRGPLHAVAVEAADEHDLLVRPEWVEHVGPNVGRVVTEMYTYVRDEVLRHRDALERVRQPFHGVVQSAARPAEHAVVEHGVLRE